MVEMSSDLKEWKELKTLEGVKESTRFIPENDPEDKSRYFRVRVR